MNRHVLVTGAAGFVGTHLVRSLLGPQNTRITAVDPAADNTWCQLFSGAMTAGRLLVSSVPFEEYSPNGDRIDEIYHLASPVGALAILPQIGRVAASIVALATKATEVAAAHNADLLYVSSSEIYWGSPSQAEDAPLIFPTLRGVRAEYALGKLAGEAIVRTAGESMGFRHNICRPFNLIGEGQQASKGFVVPRFIEAALAGSPLEIWGDGEDIRSFCYVGDLVSGLELLQASILNGQTLNLGNPDAKTSIRDLADRIRVLCHSNAPHEFVDPRRRYGPGFATAPAKYPEVTRARIDLGWSPTTPLTQSLEKILRQYSDGTGNTR